MPFAEKPKVDQAATFAGWKAGIKALGKGKLQQANKDEQRERRARQLQPRRRQRVVGRG